MAELDPRLDPRSAARRRPRASTAPLLLQMTRGCLWVYALGCLASALLLASTLQPPGQAATFSIVYATLAMAALAASRAAGPWLGHALTALLSLLTLVIAATTIRLGWGLAAPGLPITALLVCVLCAAAGWRAGAVLAAVATASVLGVAWLSPLHLVPPSMPGAALQLGTHLIAISAGLACGGMISQVLARYMRSAHEREHRFGRLLALAADAYWEIDQNYRLVAAAQQAGDTRPLSARRGLGSVPWELPQFGCDAETLDALMADLDARQPFRDLPVRWARADGSDRAYLISGEPRFDERDIFTGYWGVARDMSVVQHAHEALVATETRYQELFAHIPTPLVLHRGSHVLDANPAALKLFGHEDLSSMLDSDMLGAYESGDSRERARRRMEALHGQTPGTALPVTDFRLVASHRTVSVRGTSVVVAAEGGPAMLAIFVDDTERLAAEDAVRRSEALLSHLVATSPDLIMLAELDTGRYAMVNHSFERMSGYTASETVGRTSLEMGIWASPELRERFVAMVRERGAVSDVAAQFITKSGKPVSLLLSAARFVMDRREYMVINARDVSERERQRLVREAILNNASIGIAVTRAQRVVLANPHFAQIYGWDMVELVGQNSALLWASDEDYWKLGAMARDALPRNEAIEIEGSARRKDGSSFTARVRGRAIDPQRLDEGTIWIVEDVTERRQSEEALARARDEAEAANRAKSAFLANTSHELRTPLNGMIGLARLARDDGVDETRRRQYLDQIALSSQSLAAIISDILDLSKIEAGKLTIEAETFDLGQELATLQRTYATLAAAHELELRFDAAPDVAGPVLGDPLRLRQIVSNFLTNAIKFTPEGWVRLTARRLSGPDTQRVRIEVQDTGHGLDAQTSARLFKPFTQADQSTTRRYGGTGLGLSICHELATLMGGSVGVHSRVGEGSNFWVELPLPPATAAPEATATALPDDGRLQGMRVLMVEDNPVNMMIAVAMLERWGVETVPAHDGREAVAAVQNAASAGQPFDAVLMDVHMPTMSGHEATRALREAGQTLPVIALTAAALVSEREAALASGMNDFLTKPIDADKLHQALQRWCIAPAAAAD